MAQYTVGKNGKYFKFTCACGSEMWDNRFKKKSEKHADLRCKNKDCPYGKNGYPNSVWLKDEEKAQLDSQYKAENPSKVKTSSSKSGSSNSSFYSGNNSSEKIPLGMQVAWAKDVAICLANNQKVKTREEFSRLYEGCLEDVKSIIDKFVAKYSKQSIQEVTREVVDTDLVSDDAEVLEPEDVTEDDATEPDSPKEKPVDEEFDFDCDDIDI